MAVRGFFYNSVNKDRKYNGQDMNEDKAPFFKEGVCFGQLEVTADGGSMKIKVDGGEKTGYGYLNLHTIHNTTVLELTISQANGTLPRIDRVVMRNDETERRPDIFVLEGAYSSNPKPTDLTNNDVIQEKCLAEIYVAAGAVEITQLDITDTRADPILCGYIASQFEDIDFYQYATQFNAWFKTVKGQLSGDVAGNLQNQIGSLQQLSTKSKENLVEAINEVSKKELDMLSTREELEANTLPNKVVDALVVKEINSDLANVNNYSTTEQVIGKWIDGRIIYRKVVSAAIPASITGVWTRIVTLPNDVKNIINVKGFSLNGYPFPYADSSFQIGFHHPSNYINIIGNTNNLAGIIVYFVVEYMK